MVRQVKAISWSTLGLCACSHACVCAHTVVKYFDISAITVEGLGSGISQFNLVQSVAMRHLKCRCNTFRNELILKIVVGANRKGFHCGEIFVRNTVSNCTKRNVGSSWHELTSLSSTRAYPVLVYHKSSFVTMICCAVLGSARNLHFVGFVQNTSRGRLRGSILSDQQKPPRLSPFPHERVVFTPCGHPDSPPCPWG